MQQKRTGSSVSFLSSGTEALGRARNIRCTVVGTGTGGLYLRATTFGMLVGFTSDARPMRRKREPGCITMTLVPRLSECQNSAVIESWRL